MADISKIQIESGTYNIKDAYLRDNSIITFNNIQTMKLDTYLSNNQIVKTLGFYNKNDKGGSYYLIREKLQNEIANEITLIDLHDTNLIAELIIEDVMNVKQFGAKGDNTTDDSTSFNLCLNNAKNILITDGTYIINTKITISEINNIKIDGNNCILNSTGCDDVMFDFEACDNIKISNLKMIALNAGSILYNDCSNIKIENCDITLNYKNGVNASALNIQRTSTSNLTTRENFEIQNCKITTSFLGILFQGKLDKYLKNIKVENCEFIGNDLNISGAGELLKIDYYTENTIITNNIFKGSKSSCITCEEKSDKIIISDNILNGENTSTYGIRTYYGQSQTSSQYLEILDNLIDNFDTGIVNEYYDNVKINNNTITNCRTNSLSLWNSDVKMVANNIIKGAGCLLRASAIFINNYIDTTTLFALQMINTNNCKIMNNIFKGGYLNCRSAEDLIVKDNTFINSDSSTVGVITVFANDTTQRNNISIKDNTINASAGNYGVYIANNYNNVLVENNSVSNTTHKLYLDSALTNVTNLDFRNNVSSNNTIPSSVGTIGDIVYNTNPTAGGVIGWVYTSSGWKGYGSISS